MQSIICHYWALANLPITNFCEAKAAKDLFTYMCIQVVHGWLCLHSQKHNFECFTFFSSAWTVSGAERSIAQFSKFFNNRSVKRPHHSGRRASFYVNQSPFSSSKPTTCKIIQSNDDLRYTEDFFPETFGHSQSLTSQVITKLQHI